MDPSQHTSPPSDLFAGSLLNATLQATEALKITAPELINFGVMDEVIPEPLGGAHGDPMASFPYIKEALLNVYNTKYGP